jgi:hypothetical protein
MSSQVSDFSLCDLLVVIEQVLKIVSKRVTEPDFDPEAVKSKSLAAGALAVWCVAMQRYVTVFRNVAPKRAALQAAMDSLESKRTQMAAVSHSSLFCGKLYAGL